MSASDLPLKAVATGDRGELRNGLTARKFDKVHVFDQPGKVLQLSSHQARSLEEIAEVFRHDGRLVEVDLSVGDFPAEVDSPQRIDAPTYPQVDFRCLSCPVDEKV